MNREGASLNSILLKTVPNSSSRSLIIPSAKLVGNSSSVISSAAVSKTTSSIDSVCATSSPGSSLLPTTASSFIREVGKNPLFASSDCSSTANKSIILQSQQPSSSSSLRPPPPLLHQSPSSSSSSSSTAMNMSSGGKESTVEGSCSLPSSPGSTPLPTLTVGPSHATEPSTGIIRERSQVKTEECNQVQENGQRNLSCEESLPKNDTIDSPSKQEEIEVAFDPTQIMVWTDGVGSLPGSDLKFKVDEFGSLEMIDEAEAQEIQRMTRTQKDSGKKSEVRETASGHHLPNINQRKCLNCGKIGDITAFVRAGKFCSQECATNQANQLRQLANSSSSSSVKPGESLIKPKSLLDSNCSRGRALINGSETGLIRRPDDSVVSMKIKRLKSSDGDNINNENQGVRRKSSEGTSLVKKTILGKKSLFVQRMKDRLDNNDGNSNNDSEKLSLPSSPSSSLINITPQSALHQSIFSMRVLQHQQEPPVGWEKHSLNLKSVLKDVKPLEVLKWKPEQVADFVNSIPGCQDIGQTFADELIDGEAFLLLNQQDIVKVLNIKLGPAVKIYNSVILIRDAMEVTP